MPQAQQQGKREYPETLDDELRFILGMQNFRACPMAHLFRAAGAEIKTKCEDEQAYVLHWMIGLYLKHGKEWMQYANADLDEAKIKTGIGTIPVESRP